MSNSGRFELWYGDAAMVFDYECDPVKPMEDYSYIIHRDGRVDVNERINTVGLNRVSLQRTLLSQISIDDLNPPLVIYIKVS